MVNAVHGLATLGDAKRLFELRRNAILSLAPKGMPIAQVEKWAASLTVAGMQQKLREMEIWVAELNGAVAAWGAIRGDRLEGLYTAPEFAGRGIGTGLLAMLEGLMRERGIVLVQAEASANAEEFYFRRGYEPTGIQSPQGARPIVKRLSSQPGANRVP